MASSSATTVETSKLEYCIICCQSLTDKDTATTRNTRRGNRNQQIFTDLCHQLKVKSPTSPNNNLCWDFEIEELPFCQPCTEAATTIKSTQELIESLQIKINDLIKRVQKKIRKTCEEGTEDVLYGTPNLHGDESRIAGQNLRRVKHFRTQVLLNAHVPQVEREAFNSRKTEPEGSQSQEPALTRSRVQKAVERRGRSKVKNAEFSDNDEDSDVQKNLRRGYINPEDLEVKVKEEVGEIREIWEEDFFSNSSPNYYSSEKGPESLGTYLGSGSDFYNAGDEEWDTSHTAFVPDESHPRPESDTDESEEEDFEDDTKDPDWSDEEVKIKRVKMEEKQKQLEEKIQEKKPPFFTTSEDGSRLIHGEYEVLKVDGKYQCCICKDVPKTMSSILQHIKIIHKGEYFMCSDCGKTFRTNNSLKGHISSYHEGKFTECPICGKPLKHRDCLRTHLWHHKSQEEKDAEVAAGNLFAIWLSKRVKKVEPKDRQCGQCGKLLGKSAIKYHEQSHLLGNERPFSCNVCSTNYRTERDLKTHERGVHAPDSKKFQCQTCLKRFPTKTLLSNHITVHTGEKPVQCDKCPKSFVTKTQLKYHQVTHTQERPYKCKNCSATYAWRGSLERHLLVCCGQAKSSRRKSSTTNNPTTEHIEIKPNIDGNVGDVESFFVPSNNYMEMETVEVYK